MTPSIQMSLSDEQIALGDAIRRLLVARNDQFADDAIQSRDLWRELADMGVLGLPFAEVDSGSGAGPTEVAVAAGEFGRALRYSPFIPAMVAGLLVVWLGTPQQRRDVVAGLASGDVVPVLAHAEPRRRHSLDVQNVVAARQGDRWVLDGVKQPVPYGDRADLLIVTARSAGDQTSLFLVDPQQEGVEVSGYRLPGGAPAASVRLAGAGAHPLGVGLDGRAALADALRHGQAAACAETVGVMDRAIELTVEFLKKRHQFGRPLSGFQALKHRAADMYVAKELASSMSWYLTQALNQGGADDIVVARARVQVGRSARLVAQHSVQLHGGVGLTEEFEIAHCFSWLTLAEYGWGTTSDHLAMLAGRVFAEDVVALFEA